MSSDHPIYAENPLYVWGARYYHDPVGFVREVLGVEPHPWQAEFLTNLARCWAKPADQRTSQDRQHTLRSGHRVGKSTALGWACIWAICTRYRFKGIITAPTSQQLYEALFAELKSSMRKLPADILVLFDLKTDAVILKSAPDDVFIATATSRQESPEALQGKHSDFVLLIGDEASGIPEAVFEASSGSMASENAIMVLASNPTRGSGFFYESHNQQAEHWTCYHVSSIDIPTVSRTWIQEMKDKYGEESNAYRIRVLGEFPKADSDTIIPLDLVLSAIGRDIADSPDALEFWGMDVARSGDDASALVRRTARALRGLPIRWRNQNTTQLATHLLAHFEGAGVKPEEICIDVIGWGAGVVDRSREFKMPVMGINVAESTTVEKAASYLGAGYANLRSELWFKMREWFETKQIVLPPRPAKGTPEYATYERFITELTMVRYRFSSTGKLLVESKDELRERKAGSPDMADALALTFAGRAALLGGEGRFKKRKDVRRHRKGVV